MQGEFEAAAFIGIVAHREAVVDAGEVAVAVGGDVPNRKLTALERRCIRRAHPAEDLAGDGEFQLGQAQQGDGPCPCADDQMRCGVRAGRSLDGDAVGVMRPVENWFVGEQGGAVSLGGTGVGLNGALGEEVAAFRFERPDHLLGQGELWELLRQLCVRQGGVAEIVFFRGELDATDRLTIGETHIQHAGLVEQSRAGFLFDLIPQSVRLLEQRHVVGVLLIG